VRHFDEKRDVLSIDMKSPAINHHVGGWNQNPTWEHFSALVEATTDGLSAPNRTVLLRHVNVALFSGIGSVEAFLNTTMHHDLREQGKTDEAIRDHLRKPTFAQKVKKWPTEFIRSQFAVPDQVLASIFSWQKLRDEITHPKVDHSIYDQLAAVPLGTMRKAIAEYIVRVLEARSERYPYWLLGWNFIGMNGDHRWPLLINNSQFIFAMRSMGFDVPAGPAQAMEAWEEQYMSSFDGYAALDEAFRPVDHCEPQGWFPRAPRLCKRWWDLIHVATCGDRTAEIRAGE
jgi:hypothetical protein